MSQIAIPVVYALVAWWFSTGLILYVIGLPRRTYPWSLLAAGILLVGAMAVLAGGPDVTATGAYLAFTGALVAWGFVEMTFLTGLITGPRTTPCPIGCTGWRRALYATETIIHHELALVAAGMLLIAVTWGSANQIAGWTFAILWVMRLSSKLNLFLGVRTLNDELLPPQLAHLRSYFRRRDMNMLFPVSIFVSAAVTALLVQDAFAPDATEFEIAGRMLLASLLALALLEHLFMMLPVSIAKLWGLERSVKPL